MNASELIKELENMVRMVGDVEVVIDQSDLDLPWFSFNNFNVGVVYLKESESDAQKDVLTGGKFYAESWAEESYDKKVILLGN